MQDSLSKFQAAGVKLYAISYDEQDALADFVRHHDIGYTVLSDAGSHVIREYGILNTLVPQHEAPFYGIPFPGTYVIDEQGVVIAKFFPRQIAMRESAETFIDAALGKVVLSDDEPSAEGQDEEVPVRVAFHGGGSFKNGLQRRIVVRFDLPPGRHIYAEPVPEGMVATSVEVRGPEGLHVEAPLLPATEPLRMAGMDFEFRVWSGRVDIEVPIWAGDELAPLLHDGTTPTEAELEITVRYQACNDQTCEIPRTETFRLTVPVETGTTPRLPLFKGSGTSTTMPTVKHFVRMLARSVKQRPWLIFHTLAYLVRQRSTVQKGPAGKAAKS